MGRAHPATVGGDADRWTDATVAGLRRPTFERRLRRSSRSALTAFVADLWTARGRKTTVEDGMVTGVDPATGRREAIAVVPSGPRRGEGATVPSRADVVVTPRATPTLRNRAEAVDARLVDHRGLADLVRYGVPSEMASAVVADHLGPPPRTDAIRRGLTAHLATIRAVLTAVADRPTLRALFVLVVAAGLVVAGAQVGGTFSGAAGGAATVDPVTPVDPHDAPSRAVGARLDQSSAPATRGSVDGDRKALARLATPPAGTAWRTLGGGPARTGFRPRIDGPRRNVTRGGRLALDVPIVGTPVVADGRAYVARIDGTVVAINMTTMAPVWTRDRVGGSAAGPTLTGDTLFVGTALDAEAPVATRHARTLAALNRTDGSVRWTSTSIASIVGPPAVVNGTVFVGTVEGWVHAIDATTGAIRWSAAIRRSVRAAPSVDRGTVYVTDAGGGVTALDATVGGVEWTAQVPGSIEAAPVATAGTVYVGTTAGTLHAIEAATGHPRWNRTVGGDVGAAIWAAPAVAYGRVYVATSDGRVTALSAGTGRNRWTAPVAATVHAPPVVAGHVVYVAGRGSNPYAGISTSRVVALEAETGRERWSHRLDGPVVAQPALTNDALYVADVFGRLDRLDACVDWRGLDGERRGPNPRPHCGNADDIEGRDGPAGNG